MLKKPLTAIITTATIAGCVAMPATAVKPSYAIAEVGFDKDHPKKVTAENNIRYQLRHRYTFRCKVNSYAGTSFKREEGLIKLRLVNGQYISISNYCQVELANPNNFIYTYQWIQVKA